MISVRVVHVYLLTTIIDSTTLLHKLSVTRVNKQRIDKFKKKIVDPPFDLYSK